MNRWRLALLLAAAALLTPASASGGMIASRDSVRFGSAAVPKPLAVPLPPRMPVIVRGSCPGVSEQGYDISCYLDKGPACVSATGCVFLASRDRYTRLHELGHAFDVQVLSASDRVWLTPYLRDDEGWCHRHQVVDGCRYRPGTPWFSDTPGADDPGERFADAYANCARRLDPAAFDFETDYGYFPSRRIHRMVCGFIRYTVRRGSSSH